MISLVSRRAALLALVIVAAGCDRKPRCSRCGMVIDERSRFLAQIGGPSGVRSFDTPKCALTVWLTEGRRGALHLIEHYSGKPVVATEIVFAEGSDVLGPMGHDLIPVAREHAARFQRDHAAKRLLELGELTKELVEGL